MSRIMACQVLHYSMFSHYYSMFSHYYSISIYYHSMFVHSYSIFTIVIQCIFICIRCRSIQLLFDTFAFCIQCSKLLFDKITLYSTFYIIIRFLNLILSFFYYLQCYNLCSKETQWLFNKHANYCLMLVPYICSIMELWVMRDVSQCQFSQGHDEHRFCGFRACFQNTLMGVMLSVAH